MPNFRFKLPSRNWLIFLTITGSWFAAVIYDRREKRKIQQKWSHLVAHIAKEPLPSNELRRKLTVFLSAPPGDGLRSAREYFKEYVKPILVSGALDYEVIEGRKEGEIRAALAEKIRQRRRAAGESGAGASSPEDETDAAKLLQEVRNNFGIHDEPGLKGDLVLGRNTWREYIRGIHEGWLGPLDAPVLETAEEDIPEVTPLPETPVVQQTTSSPPPPSPSAATATATATETTTSTSTTETTTPPSTDNQTSTEPPTPTKSEEDTKAEEKKKEEEKKEADKKKGPTPSYLLPSAYASQPLPPTLPDVLEPSCPIYFPHILGFLNTPIRMYRFLNKRKVAESVGEEVAALVLAAQVREYKYGVEQSHTHDTSADASPVSSESTEPNNKTLEPQWEQASLLEIEEADWHKSARRERPDALEREWLDPIVLDSRIASRMRRFVVPEEERERSQRIFEGQEWIRGEEKPADVPLWQMVKDYMGFGEDNHPSRKVVVGNYEGEFDE